MIQLLNSTRVLVLPLTHSQTYQNMVMSGGKFYPPLIFHYHDEVALYVGQLFQVLRHLAELLILIRRVMRGVVVQSLDLLFLVVLVYWSFV